MPLLAVEWPVRAIRFFRAVIPLGDVVPAPAAVPCLILGRNDGPHLEKRRVGNARASAGTDKAERTNMAWLAPPELDKMRIPRTLQQLKDLRLGTLQVDQSETSKLAARSHTSKRKGEIAHQFAALPFKEDRGEILVMLVTSRDTGRWVLPKGWAEKGLSGAQLATKEAYEEAGVLGQPSRTSIGAYRYIKRMPKGRVVECVVKVFPLRVTAVMTAWPEADQRRRDWFTPSQAALLVNESELAALLVGLSLPGS